MCNTTKLGRFSNTALSSEHQCIKLAADWSKSSRQVSDKLNCSCTSQNTVEICLSIGTAAFGSQVGFRGQRLLISPQGPAGALPALLHCSALATTWSLDQGLPRRQASMSGALSVLQHNLPAGTASGLRAAPACEVESTCAGFTPSRKSCAATAGSKCHCQRIQAPALAALLKGQG